MELLDLLAALNSSIGPCDWLYQTQFRAFREKSFPGFSTISTRQKSMGLNQTNFISRRLKWPIFNHKNIIIWCTMKTCLNTCILKYKTENQSVAIKLLAESLLHNIYYILSVKLKLFISKFIYEENVNPIFTGKLDSYCFPTLNPKSSAHERFRREKF